MKTNTKLFLYVAIIGLAVLLIFFWFSKDLPSKALVDFLSFYKNPTSMPSGFFRDELLKDPFWDIFVEGKLIKGYRVTKSKNIGDGEVRVTASLTTEYGVVSLDFILSNKKGKWIIAQFPKTTLINGAIPLSKNGGMEYCMDVAGTKLYCTLPSPEDVIELGIPISLTLMDNYIVEYQKLHPLNLNRIMSASKEYIEDAILGKIPIDSPISIYDISKEVPEYMGRKILPIGIAPVTIFKSHPSSPKAIIAYIDTSQITYDTIRVVLNDSDYKSLYHEEIRLSSNDGMIIKNLIDNINYDIDAGKDVIFKSHEESVSVYLNKDLLGISPHRWYILPKEHSRITVKNIERSHSHGLEGTSYRGNMEVSRDSNGLILINELALEEYLYSVVPSEMPVKFGLESLKVQAIAARSYATRCLNSVGYLGLGAHVDDSTASQMYNNSDEEVIVLKAVDETKGLVPIYEENIVDARFFSTSCGYTANFHETWSIDDAFPSNEVPYLSANPQFPGDAASLYNEENFKAFINKRDPQAYDRFSPFFRWSTTIKRSQLEDIIEENLSKLQKSQPQFILTRDGDGSYSSMPIPEDIGQLFNIVPIQRGQGGNIMVLDISTTSGIYRIIKELNIRQLLRPVNLTHGEEPIAIKRGDDSIVTDFPILPSSFFYMDIIRDDSGLISNIVFNGGGYGHGVGMSQHGVYGLSLMGKSYKEIIEHFYPGSKLKSLY